MQYAYIENGVVHGLVPIYDPVFPKVPIEERFSADFVAMCQLVEDTVQVEYIKTETGFEAPPAPEPYVPQPTPVIPDRVAILEAQLVQSDDAAIALFEAKTAQEKVNAQQDDAILTIYEKIGGITA